MTSEGFKFRGQMFGTMSDLLRWFKKHFRDPVPTPSTLRGAMTSRTPYTAIPGAVSEMNQEAIQRVAQNLSHHMLHLLSQVADQTPHHYLPHSVSEYTIHVVRPDPIHDLVPNASSHIASWPAYSQIRPTNTKLSSRTLRASAATFDDTRSSQIRSIAQTYATLIHSLQ